MTVHDLPHSPILAIHPGALGDCILLGRVLAKMEGEVTFVGHAAVAKLLQGLGAIENWIDFDLLPMHELFTDTPIEQGRLAKQLGTCGRLISFYAEGNPVVEQRLIRTACAKEATFLPIRPPADYPGHLTELWLTKLALPCKKNDLCTPTWVVPDEWKQAARRRLTEAGVVDEKYVVLHPGAGGPKKRWPLEKFAEVAELVQSRLDSQPVFVLGPVECEMFTKSEINFLNAYTIVKDITMEEFAGLLAEAKALVGNDSGPAHLSASIGITTICIFCTTSVVHFAPLGPKVKVFQGYDAFEVVAKDIIRAILHRSVG